MQPARRILGLISAVLLLASLTYAATITGAVKGPDGMPFKGAFVEAQNVKTHITVNVLSDKDGVYQVDNLSAGNYDLRIRAIGYKAEPRSGVSLKSGQKASFDWNLQKGTVRWTDLSLYQGEKLMPEGKGKGILENRCFACHLFQTKMAGVQRDEDGWKQAVNYMRTAMHYRFGNIPDDEANTLISYLNGTFGADSNVPQTVDAMPEYRGLVRSFSDEAMKIVYVTYQVPGGAMPFSAAPDKDGKLWMPYFGSADRIGRLDPDTGAIEEFRVPFQGTAGIHSAVPAADGTVWFTEQGSNRLGKWDPATKEIIEYQDAYAPGMEGLQDGGEKHTLRIDPKGVVWSSGHPLSLFDPKTKKFTDFPDVQGPYGIAMAPDGTPWFAETGYGDIGKVDPKTLTITKYPVPTAKAVPRRIQVDTDGVVWFAEYRGGKIARFDPKTETFKEFPLPGPSPTPYAFGIDQDHRLWYSSYDEDLVGCLDPNTGKVIEYPFPYSENTMREFFMDTKGRMWFGTPSNNKVGYFYPANN